MGHSATICESTTSCPIRVSQPNVSHHRMPNQLKTMAIITIPSHELQDGDSKYKKGLLTPAKKVCSSNVFSQYCIWSCSIHTDKKDFYKGDWSLVRFVWNHGNLIETLEKDISLSILKRPLSLYPDTAHPHPSHENLRTTYTRLKRLLYQFIILLTQHTV